MSDSMGRYVHELGNLKRVARSGWWLAGIRHPESVAEHSWRTAMIALTLADMEGADPFRAAALALLHDVGEARVGDTHRLGRRYLETDEAEDRVFRDQVEGLPETVRARLEELWVEYGEQSTPESKIAKDADRLECLFQAREYAASGHPVDEWIESSRRALKTKSAQDVADDDPGSESWRLCEG
ncbi:MAG: HD domain-containing protein [Planctomycetota bacterium]